MEYSLEISDIGINLKPEELIHRLNGGKTKISPRLKNLAAEAVDKIRDIAKPRVFVTTFSLEDGAVIKQAFASEKVKSKKLDRLLGNCGRAGAFVVTLGDRIDTEIKNAIEKKPHIGFVLDAGASLAAEQIAENMMEQINEGLPDRLGTTLRYSPGYCDWPLKAQKKLFDVLPDKPAGVELSENCLMSPRKSISGIFGIASKDKLEQIGNACIGCKRECNHRRQ